MLGRSLRLAVVGAEEALHPLPLGAPGVAPPRTLGLGELEGVEAAPDRLAVDLVLAGELAEKRARANAAAVTRYARLLYARSAPYYDLVHADVDYEGESERLHRLIRSRAPNACSLLDVGCGTGRHLEHLRAHYEVEGLDISRPLLELARERLPGVPLRQADLRSFDLERRFDIVTCLFAAIGYAETRDGLHAAARVLAAHLAPRGLLLIEPWVPPVDGFRFAEAFTADSTLGLARAGVGTSQGGVFASETHYLVARASGVEHFSESHILGLFQLDDYERALRSAGLEPEYLPQNRGLFLAVRR